MRPVKRLEIIVSSREMQKVLEKLDEAGAPGYSVIRDVVGRSNSGSVSDEFDFACTTLSNVYILVFCSDEQITAVREGVRPLLKKFGGVCYVSDAVDIK